MTGRTSEFCDAAIPLFTPVPCSPLPFNFLPSAGEPICDLSSDASCVAVVFSPVLLVGVLNSFLQLDCVAMHRVHRCKVEKIGQVEHHAYS